MKIHSTPHACYVSLRNGLTLELSFDAIPSPRHWSADAELPKARMAQRSTGVWLFGEEVLFEVHIGQA